MTKRRAVLYARKSKKVGDEQSKSVTDQLEDCRRYAKAKGWTIAAELRDDGVSGSTVPWRKRPDFARAVTMFEDGEADTFVTLWSSRLSRDEADRRSLPIMFRSLGVEWHAVDDGGLIETETYDGYLRDAVRGLIDVAESKRRSETWRAAQRRRIEQGRPKDGVSRFGYTKDGPDFVPDAVTGPVLRDLYLRYAAGAGFQDLVRWLNAEGISTTRGGTWSAQTLLRTLDSGFGAGRLISAGKVPAERNGIHEPVITDDLWTAYLDARHARRQLPPKSRTARWALSGIVVCGLCGGNMVSANNAKRLLRCSNYNSKRTCSGTWATATTIENLTEFFLLGWKEKEFAAVMTAERGAAVEQARAVASGRESDLERLQQALGRLASAYALGEMDDEAHRRAQGGLVAQRDQAEAELREAREEVARLGPITDVLDAEAMVDKSPGEFGRDVGRVVRRIEVTKDAFRFVPVVGEPIAFDR